MSLLRRPLLALAQNASVRELVTTLPASAAVVRPYVAGEATADAVKATRELVDEGLHVALELLGEPTVSEACVQARVLAHLDLFRSLAEEGVARRTEVAVSPLALGHHLPGDGPEVALEHARTLCRAARNSGAWLTLDLVGHADTDGGLALLRELRKDFPELGVVLQARLWRTEDDLRDLVYEGSRVRLCRGAVADPTIGFTDPLDVDRSFVRCLKVLMAGQGHPVVATHDPRMIAITTSLAARHGREPGSYELQLHHGVRPDLQDRLVRRGERLRVQLAYGGEWYDYLVRLLAERPRRVTGLLRSMVQRRSAVEKS